LQKCNLQFGEKYVLDLHLSLVHGDKMAIKNEPLEDNFEEPQTSEKVFSDDVVDKGRKCDICNSTFKTKGTLKRHMQSAHEGKERKKSFQCNMCEDSFTQKGSLNMHIASVHEGKK
jgi:uncharacterized Zn-finger protein